MYTQTSEGITLFCTALELQ
uniref:Uncharacterized protein n=1 Tax=Anguilla anguilla TaxID=7936 RepID=A0A0E9QH28_ANGAN